MDVLLRIKRLVLEGRMRITEKSRDEMELDDIEPAEVAEAILSARRIDKTLRSRNPRRSHASEKLYVIKGFSYKGTSIYTKGRFGRDHGEQVYYILISAKIDSP
ncbi:MAG: hypothetical protein AABZ08_01480 [Planctomycetota bacterium]